jgi:adenine-specific DNA-methyltransferase
MLQRYLGNKSFLADHILKIVDRLARPGDLVCDPFAGSLAVSMALRRSGYRVASNDINILSWVYGTAYLLNSGIPPIPIEKIVPRAFLKARGFGDRRENRADRLALLLHYLPRENVSDIPAAQRRSDIFDHYCEAGERSAFESSRGQRGRRRFFSARNARSIDRCLSRIRWWWRSGQIDTKLRCVLTACLLDAVEKVSNTQGTYHDFPRDFYDPRSLRPLKLLMPDVNNFTGSVANIVGKAEDSLEFVKRVPTHAVLYIDPPYNFRQYTAYYFLPNMISAYPEIGDLDNYFSNIQYVRGQNMKTDFTSSFCSSRTFMNSLYAVIERSQCRHVVMSYFDGKNHWSDFKSESDTKGHAELRRFFSSSLFVPGSQVCKPVTRLNYQSYGGYDARFVQEFLFVAERKQEPAGGRIGVGLCTKWQRIKRLARASGSGRICA